MPANQYLPWATGAGANVLTPAAYAARTELAQGVQNGTADPTLANTTWRQASMAMALLGSFIASNQTLDVLDDGNVSTLQAKFLVALQNALQADILGLISANAPAFVTNPTIYVRTDGSDTNTGLSNTAAGAFASIQAAINYSLSKYYFPGGQINIQLGVPGTYNGNVNVAPSVGAINIIGNAQSQGSYVVAASGPAGGSGSCITATSATVNLIGLTIQNTGSLNATIGSRIGGNINIQNVTITGTNPSNIAYSLWAVQGGNIGIGPGCIFSQSCASAFLSSGNGIITMYSSITFTGTPAFSAATCDCVTGGFFSVASGGWTFTGSATGVRYIAAQNGNISTGGAGANFFPGSSPGTTSTGGQYA